MARKRRGRDEGSIYQRDSDKLWCANVSLGIDAEGKRIRKTVYGKSKGEVKDKLKELHQDALNGKPMKNEKITVDKHFQDWLRVKKGEVKPTTHSNYLSIYNTHIKPNFGGLQLKSLTYRRVNALYEKLDEQNLSKRTVGYVATLLRSGLDDAVRKGLIPNNQAKLAATRRQDKKEARFLDQEGVKGFLAACKGERLEHGFTVALHTGLRPGEWLGLPWDAVDLENKRITVKQALNDQGGKVWLDDVKTDAGRRTISLSDIAVEALKRQHIKQMEEKLALQKEGWANPQNLVFTNTNGGLLRRTNVAKRAFQGILFKMAKEILGEDKLPMVEVGKKKRKKVDKPLAISQAGLDGISLHTLRHTHVSILIFQGVDIKTISKRIGHEDVAFTLQVYGHLLPGQDERAAEQMNLFANSLS